MNTIYRGFAARAHSAYPIVHNFLDASVLPPDVAGPLTAAERHWRDPYLGVTTDGQVRPGLYPLPTARIDDSTAAIRAKEFLESLPAQLRARVLQPLDAPEWRLWSNAFPTWVPSVGVLLDDLGEQSRDRALAMMQACLSPSGYLEIRTAMKLNEALGELIDDYRDTLREYMYQLTIFGAPGPAGAWGWQLAGHHLDVHCVLVDGHMVMAPVFIGAEPSQAIGGRHDGERLFAENQSLARELRASFDATQAQVAVLGTSLRHDDLPPELADPHNGRHQAGMGRDNVVIPYAGITADRLSPGQQELLSRLIDLYIGRMPAGHAARKRRAVAAHLHETRLAWRGGYGEDDPFYYRIHSPVLLIEFDHHVGAFLANDEPEPFHCHTIVREPNGNDYGRDVLRQHLERWHRLDTATH